MKKGLFCVLVCMLMIVSTIIPVSGSILTKKKSDGSGVSNLNNYNLIVIMKPYKFLNNHSAGAKFYVNVTNEGPDACENYSYDLKVFVLFGRFPLKDWVHWLSWNFNYSGSRIEPNSYEETSSTINPTPAGWFIVKVTVYANDNNIKDNVDFRIIWVWK